jgi:hypothetical protein
MFGRRLSRALVVTATAFSVLMVSATFADTIQVDGDIASNGQGSTNVCLTAGTGKTVTANLNLKYNGNDHFNDGTVTITASLDGDRGSSFITADGGSLSLSGWSAGDDVNTNLNITIADDWDTTSATDPGPYKIVYTLSQVGNTYVADNSSNMNVVNINGTECGGGGGGPTNAAPSVTATWVPNSVGCRVASTLNVNFTDADSTSWTAAIDWDYQSSTFTADQNVGSVTPGPQVPSFSATHAYNAPGTYTAAVQVTDNQGAVGSDIDDLTVNQTYSANFLQPLDGSSPSRLIANTMKKGRVVPVKITITDDCTLLPVNDPATVVTITVKTATFTPTASDAVESFSDAGQSAGQTVAFRWSADSSVAGGGFWIYNLDSTGFQIGTCYEIRAVVGGITASNYALLKPTK